MCRRLEREHCDIGFDFVCWACSVASGYRGRFACHVSLSSFFAVAVLCCVLSCVYFFLAFPCFIDRALYFRSRFFQLCLSGIALLALLPCLVLLASSSLSDPLFSIYLPMILLWSSLCLSVSLHVLWSSGLPPCMGLGLMWSLCLPGFPFYICFLLLLRIVHTPMPTSCLP